VIDWQEINRQIICCEREMILTYHEAQPMAYQTKRFYRCHTCSRERIIFVAKFDGKWREGSLL